jgi:hypothetical protein
MNNASASHGARPVLPQLIQCRKNCLGAIADVHVTARAHRSYDLRVRVGRVVRVNDIRAEATA